MLVRTLLGAITAAIAAPITFGAARNLVNAALVSHSLSDALNQGGSMGVILGYATSSISVFGIVRIARTVRGVRLHGFFFWIAAFTIISTAFLLGRTVGTVALGSQLGFLAGVAAAAACVMQVSRLKFEYRFDPHISGPRRGTSRAIVREYGPAPHGSMPWGASWIRMDEECNGGVILVGKPGRGKTQFLKMLMASKANSEGLWFVFDYKNEFVPYLVGLHKRVIILNPLDMRAAAWDLSTDIVNIGLARALAEVLIPDDKTGDPHWPRIARIALTEVIAYFIAQSNKTGRRWELRDVFLAICSLPYLIHVLEQKPENSYLVQLFTGVDERTGRNDYWTTLLSRSQRYFVIASLSHRATERVSLKELVFNPPENTAVVIGTDFTYGSTTRAIQSVFLTRLKDYLKSLPDNPPEPTYIWLDEMAEGSKDIGINSKEIQEMGRSKRVCMVMTVQSVNALYEKFGKDVTGQIIGHCSHRANFGSDQETAERFSKAIGNEVRIQFRTGFEEQFGKSTGLAPLKKRGGDREVSDSYEVVSKPLFPPEDFHPEAMPKPEGILEITGVFAGGFTHPHVHTYDEQTIRSAQGEADPDVSGYVRHDEPTLPFELEPWTQAEREFWGFPALSGGEQVIDQTHQTQTKSRDEFAEWLHATRDFVDRLCRLTGIPDDVQQLTEPDCKLLLQAIKLINARWSEDEIIEYFNDSADARAA